MTSTTKKTDMTMFRGWDHPGQYVWSPFVTKLEARLRFADVQYATGAGSPRSGPKGKIPYLAYHTPSEGNMALADSSLISRELTRTGVLPDLASGLSPEQAAFDMSLRALFEDKLYFYGGRERWINNYVTMRDHVLEAIPYPIRLVIGLIVYRKNVAMLEGQGSGRFSDAELTVFKQEIWNTLEALLSKSRANAGPYPFWVLGGAGPTEADTTIFGFVVSALVCTAGPESQKIVRGLPHVMEYARRIHDQYFPDYQLWPETFSS